MIQDVNSHISNYQNIWRQNCTRLVWKNKQQTVVFLECRNNRIHDRKDIGDVPVYCIMTVSSKCLCDFFNVSGRIKPLIINCGTQLVSRRPNQKKSYSNNNHNITPLSTRSYSNLSCQYLLAFCDFNNIILL